MSCVSSPSGTSQRQDRRRRKKRLMLRSFDSAAKGQLIFQLKYVSNVKQTDL